MRINLDNVKFIYYTGMDFDDMKKLRALRPFSKEVCLFLEELSKEIFSNEECRNYSDIISFGFFCRKSNIRKIKDDYKNVLERNIGRGLSFHIAPSNVPINFAYSLVMGLLSGNSCIVRTSSKQFAQIEIICRLIKRVLENNEVLKNYICILTYDRNIEITRYFSLICDSRIIWGGDNTVNQIRSVPISPKSVELTFSDRYSIAIINAKSINANQFSEKNAKEFYNDTYLYDQNACSSPRLIVWLGESNEIEKAKGKFWDLIYKEVKNNYKMEPIVAVNKLLNSCKCAIYMNDISIENTYDNLINRIHLKHLSDNISEIKCAGGSFLEYGDTTLNELEKVINNKYQTISYFGLDARELREWVLENGLTGVDRIVPIGKTTEFSLIWDGYDIIRTLSRVCDVI